MSENTYQVTCWDEASGTQLYRNVEVKARHATAARLAADEQQKNSIPLTYANQARRYQIVPVEV